MWQQIIGQWRLIWESQNRPEFFRQEWVIIMLAIAAAVLLWRKWRLSMLILAAAALVQVIFTMAKFLSWSHATVYNTLIVGVLAVLIILGILGELFLSER